MLKRLGKISIGDIGGRKRRFCCGSGLAVIASRLVIRYYKKRTTGGGFGIVWDYSCNPRINLFPHIELNSGYGKKCYKMTTK